MTGQTLQAHCRIDSKLGEGCEARGSAERRIRNNAIRSLEGPLSPYP